MIEFGFRNLSVLILSVVVALPVVAEVAPMQKIVYKTVPSKTGKSSQLKLHLFEPAGRDKKHALPAIVFFFGGGWVGGSPRQFYPQCNYLVEREMVAISAEYRTFKSYGTSPFACVEDGKSAVRYIREHAEELGIDPNKIIAGGGSAGGHVAICTAVISGYEAEAESREISSVPNAVVAMNPVVDTTSTGFGYRKFKGRETDVSPCHHITNDLPPTVIFHGTADKTVPIENVQRFTALMQKSGNDCVLHEFEGRGHGFFNPKAFRKNNTDDDFNKTMLLTTAFLAKYGLIDADADKKKEVNMIHLWPGNVPGENASKQPAGSKARGGVTRLSNVLDPLLEVYPAPVTSRNGLGVIVCPGGGYSILAIDKEGYEVAEWLNGQGITAFVLQYRVPKKQKGALQDLQRAMRIVRSRAEEWGIDPEKLGVMGFSAGGSLAARASTLYDRQTYDTIDKSDSLSCKPSFSILIYPAYLDKGPGKTLTPELKVDKNTPPMFLFVAKNDPYANSSRVMTEALKEAGVPVESHTVPKGGHGYGLRPGNPAAETWPPLAEEWLKQFWK